MAIVMVVRPANVPLRACSPTAEVSDIFCSLFARCGKWRLLISMPKTGGGRKADSAKRHKGLKLQRGVLLCVDETVQSKKKGNKTPENSRLEERCLVSRLTCADSNIASWQCRRRGNPCRVIKNRQIRHTPIHPPVVSLLDVHCFFPLRGINMSGVGGCAALQDGRGLAAVC